MHHNSDNDHKQQVSNSHTASHTASHPACFQMNICSSFDTSHLKSIQRNRCMLLRALPCSPSISLLIGFFVYNLGHCEGRWILKYFMAWYFFIKVICRVGLCEDDRKWSPHHFLSDLMYDFEECNIHTYKGKSKKYYCLIIYGLESRKTVGNLRLTWTFLFHLTILSYLQKCLGLLRHSWIYRNFSLWQK